MKRKVLVIAATVVWGIYLISSWEAIQTGIQQRKALNLTISQQKELLTESRDLVASFSRQVEAFQLELERRDQYFKAQRVADWESIQEFNKEQLKKNK